MVGPGGTLLPGSVSFRAYSTTKYDNARKHDHSDLRGSVLDVISDRIVGALARVAVVAGLIVAPAAFAQEEGGEAGVIYQKKTIVNFDEDTIDGDLTRPDAAYVESRKRVRHSNLIRIREDFREKILGSVSTL